MARKTRAQKEKARARRANKEQLSTRPGLVNREFEFTFDLSNLKQNIKSQEERNDKSLYLNSINSTFSDLAKTVLLALAIFSFELMLYWAWFKQ